MSKGRRTRASVMYRASVSMGASMSVGARASTRFAGFDEGGRIFDRLFLQPPMGLIIAAERAIHVGTAKA